MSSTAGSDPLSALIVGCGGIAGGNNTDTGPSHARAYTDESGFRIAACVDPDDERRNRFMEAWNVPVGYARLEDVEGAFDVASLCVPTDLHADLLRRLLTMPVRLVYAEKPLTADLPSSRALVAAYQEANRPLAVNYLRRWAPEIQALRDEIEDGAWGGLQKAVCCYTKGLLNNGGHAIDLMRFLFGELTPIGALGRVEDGRAEDPTLDVQLETESGASVLLLGYDMRHFTLFEITLIFEQGRVILSDSGFEIVRQSVARSARFAGYRMLDQGTAKPTGLDRAMNYALGNIRAHLTEGEPLISDGASALAAQEICVSAARMGARGTIHGVSS